MKSIKEHIGFVVGSGAPSLGGHSMIAGAVVCYDNSFQTIPSNFLARRFKLSTFLGDK